MEKRTYRRVIMTFRKKLQAKRDKKAFEAWYSEQPKQEEYSITIMTKDEQKEFSKAMDDKIRKQIMREEWNKLKKKRK